MYYSRFSEKKLRPFLEYTYIEKVSQTSKSPVPYRLHLTKIEYESREQYVWDGFF